ncbi:DNA transposase THAP9 [Pseudolycoriella hygida]|uniref:DNA transposase THAP9 n=1 Tax=Pseudolycoriella hygida TaxID=35572 RepID=A0A9Q0ND97_9DIPT|nr:DNA transposase THAP9 [Pseudolycoriella hygida]
MVYICCVPGCGTTGNKIFHSFPKDPNQCEKWRLATMCFHLNKHTAWKTHHNVCRLHFKQTDFKNWNLLKKNVVPSLVLPNTITMEHEYCARNSIFIPSTEEYHMLHIADEIMEVDTENVSKVVQLRSVIYEDTTEAIASVGVDTVMEVGTENVNEAVQSRSAIYENATDAIVHATVGFPVKCCEVDSENANRSDEKVDWISDGNMIVKAIILDSEHCVAEEPKTSESTQEAFKPKLSRTYDPIARKMRYLAERNKILSRKLKEMQASNLKSNKKSKITQRKVQFALKTLSTELPSAQYDFIKLQIKNSGKKKKGYRFTFDEKSLALVVYKQNPKRYKDLLRYTNLPTRRTLIKHAAALHFKEGINRKLMDFIKTEVSQMNEIDRFCTIVWDEMSLSTHLDFYPIKDYIDGFEDLESKRSTDFATHALVFMVRGMNKAYKQPISYFLTNTICAAELAELIQLVISVVIDAGLKVVGSVCDAVNSNMAAVKRLINPKGMNKAYKQPISYFLTNTICAAELAELIQLVISVVIDAGLKVVGSVCDAVNSNMAAVKRLINPKCVRGIMLGKLLEYTVRDATICHYFDPPHLIKSVRNNMMVKNLNHTVSFNEAKFRPNGVLAWNKKNKQHRSASWSDLRDFYRFNNTGAFFNLIPKITDEHLDPTRHKMKVKIATQVFSGTVGRNMYLCWKRNVFKNNCIGTAAILLFFNELFDSVNGGDVPDPETLTGALTVKSKHFDFWDYAIRMLESMKFSDNLKTGKPNRSNVFKHFTSTLKGIRRISERLFEAGIQSISLRRWNQDGLENHFGIIRSLCGSNTKPNARDFRSAYSTSIINNLLTDNSLNANCEPDDDKPMLQNLQILFNSQQLTVEKLGEEESADSATGKQKFMAIVKMLNEKEHCK